MHRNPAALASIYGGIDPSPGQIRLIKAICSQDPQHSQIIVKAPRGSGKTSIVAISFAYLHRIDPTWKILVQSGSYQQARYLYSYYQPLITNSELFPQDQLLHEPTADLVRFKAGGFLRILSASEKQSRGIHVDIMVLDEAVLMNQDTIDAVWPTVRTSKRPKRIVMSTPSPKVGLEWFVEKWQDADRLKFERHEWPLAECHWINQDDTARAQLMYGVDSETYRVEFLGEIAERKGRVWDSQIIDGPQTPEKPHPCAIVDPNNQGEYPLPLAPPATEWAIGLDWGFIHPTVITAWEKQGETVFARDCRIRTQESFTDIRQEIVTDYPKVTVYADSSSPGENNDLRNIGADVFPVIFSQEKSELISHVRWRLEQGFLKIPDPAIDPTFLPLVQQMKAYHYDEKSQKPAKVNDDCVDSMLCAMKGFLNEATFELVGAKRRW
ncbi:MAG: phage terminase large subunit [Candidatus Bathyarchaeia archaeon]